MAVHETNLLAYFDSWPLLSLELSDTHARFIPSIETLAPSLFHSSPHTLSAITNPGLNSHPTSSRLTEPRTEDLDTQQAARRLVRDQFDIATTSTSILTDH